jgi:hypothetical protein
MSAREWFKCPFCKSEMEKAKQEYGKIPLDKFLEKYKENLVTEWDNDGEDPADTETVRMDGEEWLDDDGTYKIEHSLFCNNCCRTWEVNISVKPSNGEDKSELVFKVPSKSGGDDHEVIVNGEDYSCDCIGYKTRKKCSHIEQIKKKLQKDL